MRAVRAAVDHLLEIAVIGRDDSDAAHALDLIEDLPHTFIDRLGRLNRGSEIAGMTDHVRVGEVDDHHIVLVGVEPLQHDVGDLAGAHLRLEIVRAHLWRRDDLAVFALEGLLRVVVEEERHVSVLLGLGAAELFEAQFAPIGGEDVLHLGRLAKCHRHGDAGVVLGHADEADVRKRRSNELLEIRVHERPGQFAGSVAPEVEEDDAVAVVDGRQRLMVLIDDAGWLDELIGDVPVVAALDGIRCAGGFEPFAAPQALIGLLDAVPSAVAVHGVESSHDRSDFAHADFGRLLLDVLDIP